MRLVWSERALDDLRDIHSFIADDNPRAAAMWISKIRKRARQVVHAPYSGRMVPESEHKNVREVLLGNYRIVYSVSGNFIAVLTVLEGHHLLDPKLVNPENK